MMKEDQLTNVLSAGTLKGDTVRNPAGEDLGTLEEIVLDLDRGRVAYVVLSTGSFLGLGGKLFALPWEMMSVDLDDKEVVVDLNEEKLSNAPGFDKDNWPDLADLSWVADVYRHYGRDPYWITVTSS